jgi:hypothetical protein
VIIGNPWFTIVARGATRLTMTPDFGRNTDSCERKMGSRTYQLLKNKKKAPITCNHAVNPPSGIAAALFMLGRLFEGSNGAPVLPLSSVTC